MGVVRVKDGVQFTIIRPAGFRILSAIDQEAANLDYDLTITSACDGPHSGPGDPHHTGEAYDIRTHDFPNGPLKKQVLDGIMQKLGWDCFYGFLEAEGTDNEHIHCQRKKGTAYP
jgi:hypothetical protein